MKKILAFLYLLLLACLAAATIFEKYEGTPFVQQHIYGAWWFSLLWGVLVAVAIAWICRQHMRRWSLIVLHASFVVILAGALLTHLTAEQGTIHLREGLPQSTYQVQKGEQTEERQLPYSLTLNRFEVRYHEGMQAVADYVSHVTITRHPTSITRHQISMNHIARYQSQRFYQGGYDDDLQGCTLVINADPWGILVTYCGYALLFIALLWLLIDPKGTFRSLLRHPLLQKGTLAVLMLLSFGSKASALTTLPKETAEEFGRLYIIYNERVCPLQTFALDFTRKLYGKPHYGPYSAEQVLTGWIFWGDEWEAEPIIKVKGRELQTQFSMGSHASMKAFFDHGYRLGPLVNEYYKGNHDALHKQAAAVDDKLMLLMELRQGKPLKVFPVGDSWFSPTDRLPGDISVDDRHFIENIFSLLYQEALEGHFDTMNEMLGKIRLYQEKKASSLPSPLRYKAERTYNNVPLPTILFMVNLTLGFLALGFNIWQLTRKRPHRVASMTFRLLNVLTFAALTVYLILRGIVSGRVPMSNGYETMLVLAWFVQLFALLMSRKVNIVLTFGFLLSGFFLLVSHISQMDPAITHMMPVLNSPLLTLHVSIIMMSYALLALTFLCGIVALFMPRQGEALQVLSRIFLYPALTTMGLGIFIGAIWANISWGTYWSWDPKETWALITFMLYAIVVHTNTLPIFRRPRAYHVFMVLAFLSIVMTYFGVNYFLGGMHSYA